MNLQRGCFLELYPTILVCCALILIYQLMLVHSVHVVYSKEFWADVG